MKEDDYLEGFELWWSDFKKNCDEAKLTLTRIDHTIAYSAYQAALKTCNGATGETCVPDTDAKKRALEDLHHLENFCRVSTGFSKYEDGYISRIKSALTQPTPQPSADKQAALMYFNALWHSIEKHMGVDPECADWPDVIRSALSAPEWLPIETLKPHLDLYRLIYWEKDGLYEITIQKIDAVFNRSRDDGYIAKYWQPLPTPPTEDKDDE